MQCTIALVKSMKMRVNCFKRTFLFLECESHDHHHHHYHPHYHRKHHHHHDHRRHHPPPPSHHHHHCHYHDHHHPLKTTFGFFRFTFDPTLQKCDYPVKVNCTTRPLLRKFFWSPSKVFFRFSFQACFASSFLCVQKHYF